MLCVWCACYVWCVCVWYVRVCMFGVVCACCVCVCVCGECVLCMCGVCGACLLCVCGVCVWSGACVLCVCGVCARVVCGDVSVRVACVVVCGV